MKSKLCLAVLILLCVLCLSLTPAHQSALAFGDFDFDSSDSSDSGDSGDYDYSDNDRGSRYSDDSRYSGGSQSEWIVWMLLIIFAIVIIIFMVFMVKVQLETDRILKIASERRNKRRNIIKSFGETSKDRVRAFQVRHPGLDVIEFKKSMEKLFIDMQEGWEKGDISQVRDGFEWQTWNKFDIMLKEKKAKGETTHVSDITIYNLEIDDAYILDGEEFLFLKIVAEYNVWISRHGLVCQGTPDTRHRMTFRWTMIRPEAEYENWVIKNIENPDKIDVTGIHSAPNPIPDAAFKNRMKEWYVLMQEGWEACEIRKFKYKLTPELWSEYSGRLQAETDTEIRTHTGNISVVSVDVRDISESNGEKLRNVYIVADLSRWVTDHDRIVQGSPDARARITTKWTIVQPDILKDEWIIRAIEEVPNDTPKEDVDPKP